MENHTVIIFGTDNLTNNLLKDYLKSNTCLKEVLTVTNQKGLSELPLLDGSNGKTIALLSASGKTWSELSTFLDNGYKEFLPEAKVILTGLDPAASDFQAKALRWGVKGFVYVSTSREMFLKAIRCVAEGGLWVPRKELERCINDLSTAPTMQDLQNIAGGILSAREIKVLSLITVGYANKSIAQKLYVTENTVKTHTYNIFRKIGVSNRFQAALWVARRISQIA